MYLPELIEELKKHDKDKVIKKGFSSPHSWRGDYSELAFEPEENTTVGAMLKCAEDSLGKTFTGYKGGEFKMGEYTEVYLAEYSTCGEELGPTLLSFMLG